VLSKEKIIFCLDFHDGDSNKNTTIFKSKQELVDITVEIWSLPFVQSMIHLDYFRSTQQYDTN
jgi:hypothetical protein